MDNFLLILITFIIFNQNFKKCSIIYKRALIFFFKHFYSNSDHSKIIVYFQTFIQIFLY